MSNFYYIEFDFFFAQITLRPILFLALFILNFACNSPKPVLEEAVNRFLKKGYTQGVIEPKGLGSCGWIISVAGNVFYDPINIEDQKFIAFTLKKEAVFFKYLPLKMKNRCENLVPIQLIEIIGKEK